jgi:FlaG/FlaF family flagellin (archaellin)
MITTLVIFASTNRNPCAVTATSDNRAVAPIISTLFLVAIALVVLGTLAVLAFGFGDQVGDVAPQSTFDSQEQNGILTVVHTGGDTIEGDNLEAVGGVIVSKPTEVNAGDRISIFVYDREVDLIYDDGKTSALLHEAEVSTAALALITLESERDILTEGDQFNGTYPTYRNPAAADENVTIAVDEGGTKVVFTLEPGDKKTPDGTGTSDSGTVTDITHTSDAGNVTVRMDV